jgi:hypothetical protein
MLMLEHESNNNILQSPTYPGLNVIMESFYGNTNVDDNLPTIRQIRNNVLGIDESISRAQAMMLLIASDFPNKHRDLQKVLENENELDSMRYLAAINLGKINTPVALEILISNSQISHVRVLEGIVIALGRIGGKSALDVVSRVRNHYQTGFIASYANFAASLISYRLGLDGNELPFPTEDKFLEVSPNASRQFPISRARENEAEFCLRCVAYKPFGIEFSEEHMYKIHMKRTPWMILFNSDFVGHPDSVQRMRSRKAIWGAIAKTNVESKLYHIAYLLLTSPSKESNIVNILIHRTNGDLIFGGKMQLKCNRSKFIIRTLDRPGALPVHIEGEYADDRLEFNKLLTSLYIQKRQEVVKGIKP